MPQMYPLNWLSLFFLFSLLFVIFNIMNYYSFINYSSRSMSLNKKNINSMNWKW